MLSKKNKGIFVPVFIQLGFGFLLGILIVIAVFVSIFRAARTNYYDFNSWGIFMKVLPSIIIFIVT